MKSILVGITALCCAVLGKEADIDNVIRLGTDSQAARSLANRRGLGRVRHLNIRDMWLQSEVLTGKVIVDKVSGVRIPADLMTKVLGFQDIVTGWIW